MNEIQPLQTTGIQRLVIEATDYARQSRAPSTLRAYQGDWRLFEQFCAANRLGSLPALPSTVALFVTKLAATHRPSSIQRKLAAISVAHKTAGVPSPIAAEIVHSTMAGVKRAKGMAKTQKSPIRARHLREGLSLMRSDLKGVRDAAIILVSYAGALRRSEVAGLDLADLTFSPEGVVLMLSRSKTDQEGSGVKVAIKTGNRADTCPVKALRNWISAAELSDGALFRPITRGGRLGATRLSDQTVCAIFKEFALLLGLDPKDFGGHSGRAGVITDGFAASVAQAVIAKHSRHRSNAISDYLREATLFDQNLSGLVGL